MLDLHKDIFTQRQTMERTDFECYHYLDVVPPEVDFHEHAFYEIFFFLSGEVSYSIEGRTYQLLVNIPIIREQDIPRPQLIGAAFDAVGHLAGQEKAGRMNAL